LGSIKIDQPKMKNFCLILLFCIVVCDEVPIGCLIWRNSFIHLSKDNENNLLLIKVKSRQQFGFIGIGAFEKPNQFENSFQVIAFPDSTLIQLTNHTQIIKKTIFKEEFDNLLYNKIDGILSFNFRVNISEINGKNYFYFAQNENQIPEKMNETFFIPNHKVTSEYRFFPLNSTGFLPECNAELNSPGRLFSQNWRVFIPTCLIYFFFAFLLLVFKDEQPLKSRYAGPFLMTFSVYVNLIGEFIPSLTTFEETSKFYCEITAYLVYLSLQIGFDFRFFNIKTHHSNNYQSQIFPSFEDP
jgi:hypothetical protein